MVCIRAYYVRKGVLVVVVEDMEDMVNLSMINKERKGQRNFGEFVYINGNCSRACKKVLG